MKVFFTKIKAPKTIFLTGLDSHATVFWLAYLLKGVGSLKSQWKASTATSAFTLRLQSAFPHAMTAHVPKPKILNPKP